MKKPKYRPIRQTFCVRTLNQVNWLRLAKKLFGGSASGNRCTIDALIKDLDTTFENQGGIPTKPLGSFPRSIEMQQANHDRAAQWAGGQAEVVQNFGSSSGFQDGGYKVGFQG